MTAAIARLPCQVTDRLRQIDPAAPHHNCCCYRAHLQLAWSQLYQASETMVVERVGALVQDKCAPLADQSQCARLQLLEMNLLFENQTHQRLT